MYEYGEGEICGIWRMIERLMHPVRRFDVLIFIVSNKYII